MAISYTLRRITITILKMLSVEFSWAIEIKHIYYGIRQQSTVFLCFYTVTHIQIIHHKILFNFGVGTS